MKEKWMREMTLQLRSAPPRPPSGPVRVAPAMLPTFSLQPTSVGDNYAKFRIGTHVYVSQSSPAACGRDGFV